MTTYTFCLCGEPWPCETHRLDDCDIPVVHFTHTVMSVPVPDRVDWRKGEFVPLDRQER